MSRLEDDMKRLKDLIFAMSEQVTININMAINGFLKTEEVTEVDDDIVDDFERKIEGICLSILIRERLFASDLKKVTGILKLVADIERIGDHAEDIVNFSNKLTKVRKDHIEKIDNLAHFVTDMFQNSITAYLTNDLELAEKTIKDDDIVDEEYANIIYQLAHKKQNITEDYMPFMIYTALVVKYLERIADHAVNIAEWVVYIITGFHKNEKIY